MRIKIIAIATFLIGFGLFLGNAEKASAQQDVTVTTTVKQSINLANNSDLAFGNIASNSTPILDPNPNGPTTQDVGSGAGYGKVSITTGNDANLYIQLNDGGSFDLTASDGQGGTSSIGYTAWLVGSQGTDFTSGTDKTIYDTDGNTNFNVQANSSGEYTLRLGGDLSSTDVSNATTGVEHTGTATISVTYQ